MRRALAMAVVLLLCLALPAGAEWVRIDTPNFVVYGESGEARTREVAGQFERFREALGRVVPGPATRAAVPTVVVVFDTLKSFEPYRPTFNGHPVQLAGYFRGSEYENVVALTVEGRTDALRTIFHEYTHLAVANVTPGLPPWAGEGLAEFYSTFRVSPDGLGGTLGGPIPSHVRLLGSTALMPMHELLSVTHASPLYNEGQRRSLFYAQSWALVHYLMLEEPTRGGRLTRYVRLVSSGTEPVAAWTDVFGAVDIIPVIRRYAAQAHLRGLIYTFSVGIEHASGVAVRVTPSEMEAVLADLLQWTAAPSLEADARLERARAMRPASGRPHALTGLALARLANGGDPLPPLLAASSDPDWLTQYYVAAGLVRRLDAVIGEERTRVLAAVARALDAVQAARPDLPHALMLRADVALRGSGDIAGALVHIRRARAAAPGRDDYAFLEVRILARQGAFADARSVLGPLMSPAATPATRDHARSLMAQVVTMEAEAAERAARAVVRELSESAPEPVEKTTQPLYRIMRSGEQRTEGLLERLECGARSVTLAVRADGRVLRFTAASLADVEFITYRDDVAGGANCGRRVPPDHVYLTWRPIKAAPPDVLGRAIAIEFLK